MRQVPAGNVELRPSSAGEGLPGSQGAVPATRLPRPATCDSSAYIRASPRNGPAGTPPPARSSIASNVDTAARGDQTFMRLQRWDDGTLTHRGLQGDDTRRVARAAAREVRVAQSAQLTIARYRQ